MPTQLRDGVWWLDLRGTNAYLLDDDGELVLVDAGLPWQTSALVDGIVQAGYRLSDLDRVFVTHYDVDHVGGLAGLDGLDVEVYAGHGDAALVDGERAPDWRTRKGALQRLLSVPSRPPDLDVHPLNEGDQVGSLTVYETPGHTPGHVSYVSEAHETAFLGDLVVESGGRFRPAPWFLNGDTGEVRRSVRAFVERSPRFQVAGPGHGVPFLRGGFDRLWEIVDDRAVTA